MYVLRVTKVSAQTAPAVQVVPALAPSMKADRHEDPPRRTRSTDTAAGTTQSNCSTFSATRTPTSSSSVCVRTASNTGAPWVSYTSVDSLPFTIFSTVFFGPEIKGRRHQHPLSSPYKPPPLATTNTQHHSSPHLSVSHPPSMRSMSVHTQPPLPRLPPRCRMHRAG